MAEQEKPPRISPGEPEGRTKQLIEICRQAKPQRILEIGTWNGRTAAMMIEAAGAKLYWGVDLFENATQMTDRREANVYCHFNQRTVENILKAATDGCEIRLFKTDSRELEADPDWLGQFDLVYVDGGQSEETIKSDCLAAEQYCQPGGIIIVDNFRNPPTPGFGSNFLKGTVLPATDEDERGFTVQQQRIR